MGYQKNPNFTLYEKKYPGFQPDEKIAWFSGRKKTVSPRITQPPPPLENQMVGPLDQCSNWTNHHFIVSKLIYLANFIKAPVMRQYLSRVVRKPDFCICKNKDADQLRGSREADQRLCFRYTDSTIPLLPKSENSSL